MTLAKGAQLGPHQILSLIGVGGMGEVYKATDTRLNRTVAIKVLATRFSDNPEMKQRFEREAQTIASLNHPHICTLFDVGNQDGVDYLVMEYLEGQTLAQRIERGPLPLDEALLVYYGVPNDGAQVVAERLARSRPGVPVGVSLVETNTGRAAPLERVIEELVEAARPFAVLADYLVLNLNCPNTDSGVNPLHDPANLRRMLECMRGIERLPPVFLKFIAPSEPPAIDAILLAVDTYEFVNGFILNVVPRRPCAGMRTPGADYEHLPGSITGMPLRPLACELLRIWYPRIDRKRHVLVGVGGVASAEDAYRMMRLGAPLVQVLTALAYRGPALVKRIKQGLCRLLERDGLRDISQAVGADHPLRA